MRDLGALGEYTFGALCSSVGITANGSQIDKHGWDFILEFPQEEVFKGEFIDLRPPTIECWVQVKASDKGKLVESITMSNLEKLAKKRLPVFFCLINFDGEAAPKSIRLVHLGSKLIHRILRRLRKLSLEENVKLNKKTMVIPFKDAYQLTGPFDLSLKSYIEDCVGDYEEYFKWKEQELKIAGFEEQSGEIHFTLPSKSPFKDMVNWTIGLSDKLEIDRLEFFKTRFDVIGDEPTFKAESGFLSILDIPSERIELIIKASKHSVGYQFDGLIKSSSAILQDAVPMQEQKFRITANIFDFVIGYDKSGMLKLNFEDSTPFPLIELRKIGQLLDLLQVQQKDKWIYLELYDEKLAGDPVKLSFLLRTKLPDLTDLIKTINRVWRIAEVYNATDLLKLSIRDLEVQAEKVRIFHAILFNEEVNYKAKFFSKDTVLTEQAKKNDSIGVVTDAAIKLGQYGLVCVFAIIGSLKQIDYEQYEILTKQTDYRRQLVLRANQIGKHEINEVKAHVIDEIQSQGQKYVAMLEDELL